MGYVVFLRGSNVGGKNVFRPAQLVAELAHLDVVNVGAAGTFVVRGPTSVAAIREELLTRLPFAPEIAIRPSSEIRALAASRPFASSAPSKEERTWAAILCGKARKHPELPHLTPAGKDWSIRIERIQGSIVLGTLHRRPSRSLFPNQVVEKEFGVPATTRWWDTIEKIARILEDQQSH